MTTAKVFRSGNSQAVRLPKEFRFEGDQVEIFRRDDEIVLKEVRPVTMRRVVELLQSLSDDFEVPKDLPPQRRKGL